MMTEESGELIETRGEVSVEWRVDNIQLEREREYTSSVFSLLDACWCLGIIRKTTLYRSPTYVFLRREDWGPPKSVIYQLRYKDSTGYDHNLGEQTLVFSKNTVASARKELHCSKTSVIICTIKSEEKHPVEVSLFRRLWNTSLSLKSILAEAEDTDLILKLKRRKKPVHIMILQSRFPGFADELNNEMEGSITGKLNIEGNEEDAFDAVLCYVYSGEPEGLSSENVYSIYRIALKYDLQELRKLCTVFLEKHLSVEGVCDVLAMADLHGEAILKERAKDFFAKNSSKILKTEKWDSFKREKPTLFLELLERMMKTND